MFNNQLAGKGGGYVCIHRASFMAVVTCEVVMICHEILNAFSIRDPTFLFCTGHQNYCQSCVHICYKRIITFTDIKDV